MVSKLPSNPEYQPPTQNVQTGTPFMCVNMNERKDTLIYSYAFLKRRTPVLYANSHHLTTMHFVKRVNMWNV